MFIKLRRKLFHLTTSEKKKLLLKSLGEETSHDCKTNRSPELGMGFTCVVFWIYFSKFSLFPKILASICLFLCKIIFSNNLLDLSGHVIDHALNWKKYDHSSYKM